MLPSIHLIRLSLRGARAVGALVLPRPEVSAFVAIVQAIQLIAIARHRVAFVNLPGTRYHVPRHGPNIDMQVCHDRAS